MACSVSCKFWVEKPSFCLCKKNRVVIKLILYNKCSYGKVSPGFMALVIKRLFYTKFEAYWKKNKNDPRDLGRHMCEGVGQDSGYGHEESHLIHNMKYSMYDCIFLYGPWYDVYVPLHEHLGGE